MNSILLLQCDSKWGQKRRSNFGVVLLLSLSVLCHAAVQCKKELQRLVRQTTTEWGSERLEQKALWNKNASCHQFFSSSLTLFLFLMGALSIHKFVDREKWRAGVNKNHRSTVLLCAFMEYFRGYFVITIEQCDDEYRWRLLLHFNHIRRCQWLVKRMCCFPSLFVFNDASLWSPSLDFVALFAEISQWKHQLFVMVSKQWNRKSTNSSASSVWRGHITCFLWTWMAREHNQS